MGRLFSATVKGGFFEQNSVPTLAAIGGLGIRRDVARILGTKSMRDDRALMTALDGVAPGSNATKTNTRVEANVELGGKRVIETETLINRNTTAADVVEIEATINNFSTKTTFGASPPVNKDGNPLGTR